MYHTVAQFGELAAVPTAGGADKVACDALQLVYVLSAAMRTFLQIRFGIFIAAVHASVAVVVH